MERAGPGTVTRSLSIRRSLQHEREDRDPLLGP